MRAQRELSRFAIAGPATIGLTKRRHAPPLAIQIPSHQDARLMRCGNADGPPNVDTFRPPRGRRSLSPAFELDLEHWCAGIAPG
jgi:hypothetical protein